eukprot:TRINITY_DN54642_c0_g1_i1.p2 TRINITY_DN54642_c0_g1~~TRINITY_DN54642_c0_g1_i1.p2  ORF type:complete len:245 (-),score=31.92 TRINITY_DN54642_c0_g1_i1:375-1109(-)
MFLTKRLDGVREMGGADLERREIATDVHFMDCVVGATVCGPRFGSPYIVSVADSPVSFLSFRSPNDHSGQKQHGEDVGIREEAWTDVTEQHREIASGEDVGADVTGQSIEASVGDVTTETSFAGVDRSSDCARPEDGQPPRHGENSYPRSPPLGFLFRQVQALAVLPFISAKTLGKHLASQAGAPFSRSRWARRFTLLLHSFPPPSFLRLLVAALGPLAAQHGFWTAMVVVMDSPFGRASLASL